MVVINSVIFLFYLSSLHTYLSQPQTVLFPKISNIILEVQKYLLIYISKSTYSRYRVFPRCRRYIFCLSIISKQLKTSREARDSLCLLLSHCWLDLFAHDAGGIHHWADCVDDLLRTLSIVAGVCSHGVRGCMYCVPDVLQTLPRGVLGQRREAVRWAAWRSAAKLETWKQFGRAFQGY